MLHIRASGQALLGLLVQRSGLREESLVSGFGVEGLESVVWG